MTRAPARPSGLRTFLSTVGGHGACWGGIFTVGLLLIPLAPLLRGRGLTLVGWVWSRLVCALSSVRVEVEGLEHVRPGACQVLVGNHCSAYDIFTMLIALRRHFYRFVVKRELLYVPVFGLVLLVTGFPMVDRRDSERARLSMDKLRERMRRTSMKALVFPEGTRNRDPGLLPFKKGPFVLALELGAPIVPFVINGSRAVMGGRQSRIHPGTITVTFFPEVPTAGLSYDDRESLLERVRSQIAAHLHPEAQP